MSETQGADAPSMPVPKVAGIIRSDRCEKCKYATPLYGGGPGQMECHRNPPQVSVTVVGAVRQKDPRTGQLHDVPQIQTAGNFPIVQMHSFCGEWRAKIEALS